jgi:hypothetical protein
MSDQPYLVMSACRSSALGRGKVPLEPVRRQARNFLQRPRFLEEVRRAGDDRKLLLALHSLVGGLVQANDDIVIFANDEQRRRPNLFQRVASQIRPAAPRYDGMHPAWPRGCRHQRGCTTGARTEAARVQPGSVRLLGDPVNRSNQALRKQIDVEAKLGGSKVDRFLLCREQIEQERRQSGVLERSRDVAVARTVTAAAAAMCEQDETGGESGKSQIPIQSDRPNRYGDGDFLHVPVHCSSGACPASCRRRITVSSEVGLKSSYQRPTA